MYYIACMKAVNPHPEDTYTAPKHAHTEDYEPLPGQKYVGLRISNSLHPSFNFFTERKRLEIKHTRGSYYEIPFGGIGKALYSGELSCDGVIYDSYTCTGSQHSACPGSASEQRFRYRYRCTQHKSTARRLLIFLNSIGPSGGSTQYITRGSIIHTRSGEIVPRCGRKIYPYYGLCLVCNVTMAAK